MENPLNIINFENQRGMRPRKNHKDWRGIAWLFGRGKGKAILQITVMHK